MQPDNSTGILWGAKSIARFIGRSVETVHHLADDPDGPVYKPGGRYCAMRDDLLAWLRTKPSRSKPAKTDVSPDLID